MNKRFHKLRGPSTHVGVYITSGEITAVKSVHSGSSVKVIDSIRESFDSEMYNDMNLFAIKLHQVLEKLIKKDEKYQLWTSIPEQHLSDLHLQMPTLPPQQQPSAALWHYQQSSRLDLGQMIFEYQMHETVSGEDEQLAFQGFTLPIEKAHELETLYQTAGFELTGITPQYLLWSQLFRYRKAKNGVHGLVHMDSNGCNIRIFDNRTEIASRHLVYSSSQLIDTFRKYQPHLTDSELMIFMASYRFNPEKDAADPLHQDIARQLSSVWRRVQQTGLIVKKQHNLTIGHFFLCGDIDHCHFINDFINTKESPELTHSNLQPHDCTPQFETDNPPPEEALALSLCNNMNVANFLYPWAHKESCLELEKKSQFIYVSLLVVLLFAAGLSFQQYLSTDSVKRLREKRSVRSVASEKGFILKKALNSINQQQTVNSVDKSLKRFSILVTLDQILETVNESKMPLESLSLFRDTNERGTFNVSAKVYYHGAKQDGELATGQLINQLEQKANLEMNRILHDTEIVLKDETVMAFEINGSKKTDNPGVK